MKADRVRVHAAAQDPGRGRAPVESLPGMQRQDLAIALALEALESAR